MHSFVFEILINSKSKYLCPREILATWVGSIGFAKISCTKPFRVSYSWKLNWFNKHYTQCVWKNVMSHFFKNYYILSRFFPTGLGDGHRESFHQDISKMKSIYQSRVNINIKDDDLLHAQTQKQMSQPFLKISQ